MAQNRNLCVLTAEVVGGPDHDASCDALEVRHAIDRCLHRAELAIEANKGHSVRRAVPCVFAGFDDADAAILAACEMLERVNTLPPLRGRVLSLRIGIHFGSVDGSDNTRGECEQVALRLARAARSGEALATGAAAMLLSPATRQYAHPEAVTRSGLEGLKWPLYAVQRKTEATAPRPPATQLLQRLRVRHRSAVLFVDEQSSTLLFGRELGNDVVIIDPRASRHHARIERRRSGFVLVDFSTNGCYVIDNGGAERCVKGGELPITGPGRFGCGFSANTAESDLVLFEIV